MTPLLALGPHIFTIAPLNYQAIERVTEAKWPAITRFGTYPGRQFTGYGEDPITISGLIYPHETGGYQAVDAIRATQAAARPVIMVGWSTATVARIFGRVVILKVSDSHERIDRTGRPRKIAFDIEIAPFVDAGKPVGIFL